ncbi:MAG: hypothetical protein LBS86_08320, partial [Treponema sp.]|nr:hypothetical protein [Treponema sp.]
EPRSLEEIKASWEDWDEWERQYQFQIAQIRLYPLPSRSSFVQKKRLPLPYSLMAALDPLRPFAYPELGVKR